MNDVNKADLEKATEALKNALKIDAKVPKQKKEEPTTVEAPAEPLPM